MFVDIPTVTRCCFCLPLRHGLLVWAYLRVFVTVVLLGADLVVTFLYTIFVPLDVYLAILYSTLIILTVDLAFTLVLIIGLHNRNESLLHIYIKYGVGYAVVTTLLCLLTTTYEMSTMDDPRSQKTWSNIVTISSIQTGIILLHAYLLVLTHSLIIKIQSSCRFRFVNHITEPSCYLEPACEET